jgi:hypothetical protein
MTNRVRGKLGYTGTLLGENWGFAVSIDKRTRLPAQLVPMGNEAKHPEQN